MSDKRKKLRQHLETVCGNQPFQFLEESRRTRAEGLAFACDVAHKHIFVGAQPDCHYVVPVQIAVEHARAGGVAVEAYEQIEQGRPVADEYAFLVRLGGKYLFEEIERIVGALLEHQTGIVVEFGYVYLFPARQGVRRRNEHVGLRLEQRRERQRLFLEHIAKHLFVEVAEIQNTQFAPERRHVLYNFVSAGFAKCEFVLVGIER